MELSDSDTTEEESLAIDEATTTNFTMSGLYQSCASSSLSRCLMELTDIAPDSSKPMQTTTEPENDCEEEFSARKFNASLYSTTSRLTETQLKALESTEVMIHRNIEKSFKGFPERKFAVGDNVLCQNPWYQPYVPQPKARDPLVPMNIEGTIVESLPGGLFKVKMTNGDEAIQKCIFKGQMVPGEERETSNIEEKVNSGNNGIVTRKSLVNSISEFGFDVGRSFYGRRLRKAPINLNSQLAMMDELYSTLDAGALSSILSEKDAARKEECHRKYTEGIGMLEKGHFAFFLYGIVSWERRQRRLLSKPFIKYLAEKGCDEGHCCLTCFRGDKNCVHECCREKAKDFAKRCGLLLLSKNKKKNAGNKIPKKKSGKKAAAGQGRSMKGTKKIRKRPSKARSTEHGENDPKLREAVCDPINKPSKAKVSVEDLLNAPLHATFPVEIKGKKLHILKVPKSAVDESHQMKEINVALLAKTKLTEIHKKNKNTDCDKQLTFLINWLQDLSKSDLTKTVIENCNYILRVLGNGTNKNVKQQVTCKLLELDGDTFQVHCQGMSLLCGLCALNNATAKDVGEFDFFTVDDLDNAADELWLLQAVAAGGLSDHYLEEMRDPNGNYSVQVVERASLHDGYTWERVDQKIKLEYEGYISAPKSQQHATQLYDLVKQSAGVSNEDCLFFHNGKDHYQALIFRENNTIVLDSIMRHVKKLNKFDALSYILKCLHTPLSAVVRVKKGTVAGPKREVILVSGEDNGLPSSEIDQRFLPISDIWYCKVSPENENAVVEKTFGDLTVHDLLSLKPGNHEKRWKILYADLLTRTLGQYNSLGENVDDQILERFSMYLSIQKFNTSFFKIKLAEEQPACTLQHADRMENGIMSICAMICIAERRPMDFSILDAIDVRRKLIHWICKGYSKSGFSHTLWKETLAKHELIDLLKEPSSGSDDAEMLLQMVQSGLVACGMEPLMARYVYELEKRGTDTKKSYRHVALTYEQVTAFHTWRDDHRAKTRHRYCWEQANPILRMWMRRNGNVCEINHPQTYDDGWVKLSNSEDEKYWHWRENLSYSLTHQ
eukprot:gene1926-2187_t